MNLFEIPAQIEREKDEDTWLVEKITRTGKRVFVPVKGEKNAADYAARIGGILIGPEKKEGENRA